MIVYAEQLRKLSLNALLAAASLSAGLLLVGCTSPGSPAAAPVITVAVSGPSSVNVGTVAQYTALASSNTPQIFTWQVDGVTGGNSTYGVISSSGVYTPPTNVPTANSLTITAVNTYAPTATGSMAVTLLDIQPVITAAVGTTANAGQSYLVDVQGADFLLGAQLMVGGKAVPTIFVATNHLETTVTPTTSGAQQIQVAVANPNPGMSLSNSISLLLNPVAPPTTQESWFSAISAPNLSPVTAQPNDPQISWTAPDGRKVQVTINAPQPLANAPTVTVGAYTAGSDATPVFATAFNSARTSGAGKILVPTGTYTFASPPSTASGHLLVSGLTDVTIDGQGSTLVFTNPYVNAIFMFALQRVKFTNFIIQWKTPTILTYTATMSTDSSGVNTLVVDPAFQALVTSADTIGKGGEYNETTHEYVVNGARFVGPAFTYNAATHAYSSTAWQGTAYAGRSYMMFEHYYNGAGIEIEDSPGPTQAHDVILDSITINDGPGMGIIAYGLQRGLVISNSQIIPAAGGLVSTDYDGMHMLLVGGDVYIHDNVIAAQADDGMNFNSPITPVISLDSTGLNPTLGVYSRFIQPNDLLSFFDASNNFIGTAYAFTAPIAQGGLNYSVQLSNAIPGLSTTTIIRDMNLTDNRTAFVNNTVRDCGCHGILMQTPNALVQGNTFSNIPANAVRLLSNIGTFFEGVGAINVLVQNNTITNTGEDSGITGEPWSAIGLYAADSAGINKVVSNKWVNIMNNNINNADQGCISVVASEVVNVMGNVCNSADLLQAGAASMQVLTSNAVVITGNSRTGSTTGVITVDPTTTSNITVQPTY